MGVSPRHLTQLNMGGDNPEYGRLRPWPTTLRRSRSFLIQCLEFLTSAVFLATRSTAVVSLLLLGWKLLLKKFAEPSTPRMVRSSGSMFAKSPMSMLTVNQSVLAHQTRLVSMLS